MAFLPMAAVATAAMESAAAPPTMAPTAAAPATPAPAAVTPSAPAIPVAVVRIPITVRIVWVISVTVEWIRIRISSITIAVRVAAAICIGVTRPVSIAGPDADVDAGLSGLGVKKDNCACHYRHHDYCFN
jgi:hypothetical protein